MNGPCIYLACPVLCSAQLKTSTCRVRMLSKAHVLSLRDAQPRLPQRAAEASAAEGCGECAAQGANVGPGVLSAQQRLLCCIFECTGSCSPSHLVTCRQSTTSPRQATASRDAEVWYEHPSHYSQARAAFSQCPSNKVPVNPSHSNQDKGASISMPGMQASYMHGIGRSKHPCQCFCSTRGGGGQIPHQ